MSCPPMTFAQRWDTAVDNSSDRPFLIFEGSDRSVSQWTYREFDAAVTCMGATLATAGMTRRPAGQAA
jgi:acyl-CoA synthetase (AMP-forming)/AMP-acid ligase II